MKKKTKLILLIVFLAIVALVAIFTGVVVAKGQQYKEVFFPNTIINGVDCSGLTADEAESKIKESVEDYQISIEFQDKDTVTFVGNSFGYSYVPDDSVEEYLAAQDWLQWIPALGSEHSYTLDTPITYDEDRLVTLLKELPELQTKNMAPPTDATLIYKDGSYMIQEATKGSQLDPDQVIKAVKKAVDATETEVDIDKLGLYTRPTVQSDDEKLTAQKDQLNNYANANITLTLCDGTTRSITPDLLKSWLSQDDQGNYYRDDAAFEAQLTEFVSEIEEAVEPDSDGMDFDTTQNGTIKVKFGIYSTFKGYELDNAAEIQQLKDEIDTHATVTREPIYASTGNGVGNHGIGNTYAEVNLTSQHMWFYKDGQMVFDTDIVSGSMTTWRYTPEGVYSIYEKQSPHTMKGEVNPATNEPIYTVECTYWMNIIPALGIGFHDYDSRSNWSTDAHWTNGSHGCINMHGYDAQTLYGLISTGDPVIMYYTEPYTLTEELSPSQQYAQNGGADSEDADDESSEHSVAEDADEEEADETDDEAAEENSNQEEGDVTEDSDAGEDVEAE